MGESSPPAAAKRTESWNEFQAALARLMGEVARQEVAGLPPAARAGGGNGNGNGAGTIPPGELRKAVTEAVSGVLLETKVIERVVEKQLKAMGGAPAAPSEESAEEARKETVKIVREYLAKNLGPLFQNEIRGVIQKEMRAFLAGDEMKELVDEKFRLINTYLKTEVIPRVVQQELERSE